jgi:predicted oxidoreductase
MKNVYLSDSGPKVSEAIYGFWRWKNRGNETVAKIEKIVNLCLELGINTFDHADIYGDFSIESYFGEVLRRKSFKRKTWCYLANVAFANRPMALLTITLRPII